MEPELRTSQPCRGPALFAAGVVGGLALWYGCYPSTYYLGWIFLIPIVWAVPIVVAGVHVALQSGWQRVRGRRLRPELQGLGLLVAWLIFVSAAIATKAPLHAHFALARSILEEVRDESRDHGRNAAGFRVGRVSEGRCDATRSLFRIENDGSYFVFSPHGVEGLCYNSGSHGALGGGWYWIVED